MEKLPSIDSLTEETDLIWGTNEYSKIQELTSNGNLEILPENILHVGDSFAADFCGARARGWNALWLDRSGDPKVNVYQDWLKDVDYPGKSDGDVEKHRITDLREIREWLE